jgi:hypothetical protein
MIEKEPLGAWLTEPLCCVLFSASLWVILILLILMFSKTASNEVESIISKIDKMK